MALFDMVGSLCKANAELGHALTGYLADLHDGPLPDPDPPPDKADAARLRAAVAPWSVNLSAPLLAAAGFGFGDWWRVARSFRLPPLDGRPAGPTLRELVAAAGADPDETPAPATLRRALIRHLCEQGGGA